MVRQYLKCESDDIFVTSCLSRLKHASTRSLDQAVTLPTCIRRHHVQAWASAISFPHCFRGFPPFQTNVDHGYFSAKLRPLCPWPDFLFVMSCELWELADRWDYVRVREREWGRTGVPYTSHVPYLWFEFSYLTLSVLCTRYLANTQVWLCIVFENISERNVSRFFSTFNANVPLFISIDFLYVTMEIYWK